MKLHIELEVEGTDNGRWRAKGPLDLTEIGSTREHAVGEWLSQFCELWIAFCEVDPGTLAPDGLRLREGLMAMVKY